MKYAYYPGCSIHASLKEYGDASLAVSKVLDIELIEIPGWNCCGAIDAIYSYRPLYSVALASRNLSLAEKMGMDIVTLCSACYFTLSRTNKLLQNDTVLKSKVMSATSNAGFNYSGSVKVRHFLEVLLTDVGLERIRAKLQNPLSHLNVASYYGCFLVRPPDITSFDDSEHPMSLDKIVEVLGASAVEYYGKTRCCGASQAVTDEAIMLELSRKILINAKDCGANCMITACPLCHFNLDAKQKDIESKFNLKIGLPVLHFTQLIGIAFGIGPKELGLHRNCVQSEKILRHHAVGAHQ